MKTREKIKILRTGKRISQKRLGELLGVSASSIQAYESGRNEPKENIIIDLAKIIGICPEVLNPEDAEADALFTSTFKEYIFDDAIEKINWHYSYTPVNKGSEVKRERNAMSYTETFKIARDQDARINEDSLFDVIVQSFPEFKWTRNGERRDEPYIKCPLIGYRRYGGFNDSLEAEIRFYVRTTDDANTILSDNKGLSVEYWLNTNGFRLSPENHTSEIELVTDVDYLFKFIQKALKDIKFASILKVIGGIGSDLYLPLDEISDAIKNH